MTHQSSLTHIISRLSWLGCLAVVGWLTGIGSALAAQHPSIVPHDINRRGIRTAPTTGSTNAVSNPIAYYGGDLIQTPTVYVIWYGNWNSTDGSDTPAGQQIVRDFLNSIGGSPYFNINKTYSTNGFNITGKVIFGGEYFDSGSSGTTLRDSSFLTIVNHALTVGTATNKALPYNPDGVYFVLTSAANINYSGFCSQFCGWHSSDYVNAGQARYSFVGNAKKCLSSCSAQSVNSPNGNPGVDGMVSVIAHELEETVTDPEIGWWDAVGYENADKCAWTFGKTLTLPSGAYYNVTLGSRNYLIQRNLIRAANGSNYCVMQ